MIAFCRCSHLTLKRSSWRGVGSPRGSTRLSCKFPFPYWEGVGGGGSRAHLSDLKSLRVWFVFSPSVAVSLSRSPIWECVAAVGHRTGDAEPRVQQWKPADTVSDPLAGLGTIKQQQPTALLYGDFQATSHGVTPFGKIKGKQKIKIKLLIQSSGFAF